MPVLVVEDRNSGHRGHCTLFEGEASARLNYGVYNDAVQQNLDHLAQVIGPALGALLRSIDGGLAQAAAFPLQAYQGGSPERMVERNLQMYGITAGEHPTFKIPSCSIGGRLQVSTCIGSSTPASPP